MRKNKERFQIRNLSRMGEASPVPLQPTAKGFGGLGARKRLGAASVMEGRSSRDAWLCWDVEGRGEWWCLGCAQQEGQQAL